MSKKYKLLQDINSVDLVAKAGAIGKVIHEQGNNPKVSFEEDRFFYLLSTVVNRPDFFEEIKEVERIDIGGMFVQKKNINFKDTWLLSFETSQPLPDGSFDKIRKAIEFVLNGSLETKSTSTSSEDEITFEKLDSLGFERWNECFTYRCFPAPLYGAVRIDKRENGDWVIYAPASTIGDSVLLYPRKMYDVLNFMKKASKTNC